VQIEEANIRRAQNCLGREGRSGDATFYAPPRDGGHRYLTGQVRGPGLERVGHDGASDSQGCVLAWSSNRDNADNRVGRVHAYDAGRAARRRLVSCYRERSRVRKLAAITRDPDNDVVTAGWFVHDWHHKPGI